MLHLDEAVDDRRFAGRTGRFGGAAGTSIAAHVICLLAFAGLTRLAPATSVPRVAVTLDPTSLVFRTFDGTGPTGDNGGNHTAAPAPRAQAPGHDPVSVVAAPPPLQPPPSVAPELAPTTAAPILPLVPMDAGDIRQIGTITGPSAPPGDARGPGNHGVGSSADGDGPGFPGGRHGVGDGGPGDAPGVRPPQILYKTPPQYTTEAMRAKLQGSAILSGIVGPDGTLHDIRIVRSLDAIFGLDDQAIACVKQWRFRPGARGSAPVAVAVTIEVAFNLR